MRRLLLIAACVLAMTAAAHAASEISFLFGSRFSIAPGADAPSITADLNGDGAEDRVFLVSIAPASEVNREAAGVTVLSNLWHAKPLGAHGAKRALAIVLGQGGGKFVITDYRGGGVRGYFETPIWDAKPLPLGYAKAGGITFLKLADQGMRAEGDIVILGTEAGIDTALYWNGKAFKLFEPAEEP